MSTSCLAIAFKGAETAFAIAIRRLQQSLLRPAAPPRRVGDVPPGNARPGGARSLAKKIHAEELLSFLGLINWCI